MYILKKWKSVNFLFFSFICNVKSTKHYHWFKIAANLESLTEQGRDGIFEIPVGGREICIAIYSGNPYAFSAKCPHASAPMNQGIIDAKGNVVCPSHHFKFSLATGKNNSGEGYHLKTFPIEQKEEGVFLGIEAIRW